MINPIELDTVDDALSWLRREGMIILHKDEDECSFCMWKAGRYTSDIDYLDDFATVEDAILYKSGEFAEWLEDEFPHLFNECIPSDYEELEDEYGDDDDGRNTGGFDLRVRDLRWGG